jgi:hypothetical protein
MDKLEIKQGSFIQQNIHVNIYVAVNLMIGGPDISGIG